MSDLEDLEIEPDEQHTRPFERPPSAPPPEGRGKLLAIVGIVVVVGALLGWYLFFRDPAPPQPPPIVAEPTPPPPAPAPPPPQPSGRYSFTDELPPLDGSDAAVAKVVSAISSHPRLVAWLARPELARTFAVVVENIASETNPAQHLGFMAPDGDFTVQDDGGTLYASEASSRRYDLMTAVFVSIDPEGAAAAYDHLSPLLEQAFADLGYPRQAFRPSLEQAFANILAVEVPTSDPELVLDISTYDYADPRLEGQSPFAKQILRLGSANARRVQRQVRRLADALGMDV